MQIKQPAMDQQLQQHHHQQQQQALAQAQAQAHLHRQQQQQSGPPEVPVVPSGQLTSNVAEQARKMQDFETLCAIISQWNANRLDLFALSLPNEDLEFHGVMRFYYQDADDTGQKVATKCIRVSSTATTKHIIETLIEKFRPDMKMLEVPEYALYEIHESGERRLNPEEKPLLVQLNWHKDDREGRFLLRRIDEQSRMPEPTKEDSSFKRKLSKREKKQLKKQEKLNKLKDKENNGTSSGKTELPDTSFTRSISNPEAVMRRRRQQKLEKKLQQYRSKDGGPDTGGTLKIYGESLCSEVPYKTLLLSIRESASHVVEEMLEKYGKDRKEVVNYCLVQCTTEVPTEIGREAITRDYYLDDDECPLAILMNHPPSRGTITFHVRPKPSDFYPRKRKKKPNVMSDSALLQQHQQAHLDQQQHLPFLFEVNPDGSDINPATGQPPPQKFVISVNVTEVGTDPAMQSNQCLLLPPAPYLFPRHCVLANTDGIVTITPSNREAETFVNNQRIFETTILQHGCVVRFGSSRSYRFIDPMIPVRERLRSQQPPSQAYPSYPNGNGQSAYPTDLNTTGNYVHYGSQRGGSQASGAPPVPPQGKDNILPAVLEFREESAEAFFNKITVSLEVPNVQFKLAPTYTLYMATRFRASTHYRPELVPEERAVRLTETLNHVAEKIYNTVQVNQQEAVVLAFWMANSSELLHFLKSDRHVTSFSLQAQDILAETVHLAFKQLVLCLQSDLKTNMPQMLLERDDDPMDGHAAIDGIMQVLSMAMNLLRKCRVNAALTIQLFSQLFHYINMWTFNQVVMSGYPNTGDQPHNFCTHRWGLRLKKRLSRIQTWAEKQGLELAADCHLARVVQASHLLLARKNTAEDIASLSSICFKLNSLQLKTLLDQYEPEPNESAISNEMIDTIVRVAENTVDEMTNSEGREVRLEEDFVLQLPFLLPEDGYSCDIVRGIPGGLVEFLAPMQQMQLCVMTPQVTSSGYWTIYMDRLDTTPAMSSPVPSELSQSTYNGQQLPPPPSHLMQQPQGQAPPPPQFQQQQQHQHQAQAFAHGAASRNEPELALIQLAKSTNNGMGLSIVAAKGAGKEKLGIYIKAVVEGGAAYHDGRLQAGDQLLKVDGQSLVGITQERAAEIMVRTGPVVELEVAKQGAIYHGLATLLSQPSPLMQRSNPAHASQQQQQQQLHLGGGGPPAPIAHSTSVPALYGEQHTYQNQNMPPPPPPAVSGGQSGSVAPPSTVGRSTSSYALRSASVSNLMPVPGRDLSTPTYVNGPTPGRPASAVDEQSYYQNIGHPAVHQQQRFMQQQQQQQIPPPPQSMHSPPNRAPTGARLSNGDLFHATPRMAGTPNVASGPEKPQRQYAYHQNPNALDSPQAPPKKGVHFQEEIEEEPSNSRPASNAGPSRVRFQEPEEMQSPEEEEDTYTQHLEHLKLSSVEKKFRKRVAEFEEIQEEEEDDDPNSASISNRILKLQEMERKQRELDETKKKEEELLREAERRRQQTSTGSGDTPPPLPDAPPPASTPPLPEDEGETLAELPPSGAERLDMLVSGASSNGKASNGPAHTKRVSFITESHVREIEERRELRNAAIAEEEVFDDEDDDDFQPGEHEPDSMSSKHRADRMRKLDSAKDDPNAFISEAESLLNSSTLALEKFDFNKTTGHTPTVIGAQEVYRDPRVKRLQKAQEEKATSKQMDGAKLSFKEKMRLFAVEAGEGTPKDKTKISRAQRDIDGTDRRKISSPI